MFKGHFGSKLAVCPYCYVHFDIGAVAFRCSGMGVAGRPSCDKVTDDLRDRHFSDSRPYLPVLYEHGADGHPIRDQNGQRRQIMGKSSSDCPLCGGRTSVRLCPHCHSILPVNLSIESPLFGLVGVRNSGKTVLLSVLHTELTRNVARRFDAAIDNPGGAAGLSGDLDAFQRGMIDHGELPGQTAAGAGKKQAPAVYEWRYARSGKTRSTIFSFYDNAGEDVSRRENAMNQTYLASAAGIIVLLDPFSFPENTGRAGATVNEAGGNPVDSPESVLDAITYVLQTAHHVKPNKKIKIPLAVVVTKIDAFFDQIPDSHPLRRPSSTEPTFDMVESQSVHDHVAALVASWGGDGLIRKLDHNFANYRMFGVSALGAEPDYSVGRINSRGLLPHRVGEPLLWLMADRNFIPTAR